MKKRHHMIDVALEAEREEGKSPRGDPPGLLRFRPIMTSTMAALLGALPLMLRQGTGSELAPARQHDRGRAAR